MDLEVVDVKRRDDMNSLSINKVNYNKVIEDAIYAINEIIVDFENIEQTNAIKEAMSNLQMAIDWLSE